MSEIALPILVVVAGLAATGIGAALIRSSGADIRAGRRLAGARAVTIRDLQELAAQDRLPAGPVRVEGRVRCANPMVLPSGDRLAALHRDVEVELPDGRWRVIERVREARPVDMWDRAASVPLDLSALAEPLITIPRVWEGPPDELGASYRPALDRLAAKGEPPRRARATTRQVTLVDELIVIAVPERDDAGQLRIHPPAGGFLVANVELETAMRLLAGPQRTRMLTGYAVGAIGVAAAVAGAIGLLFALSG